MTKKKFYLRETVPAGPRAAKEAEKIRVRLLNEIYERRNPRTDATVAQLVERHLKEAELDDSTLSTYQGYATKHIVPLLGTTKVRASGADGLDTDPSRNINHSTATSLCQRQELLSAARGVAANA